MDTEFCEEWLDLLDCGHYLQAACESAFADMELDRLMEVSKAATAQFSRVTLPMGNMPVYGRGNKERQHERELLAKDTRISELQVDNARLRSENKRLRTEENGTAYRKMVKNLTEKIATGQLDATHSSCIQMMIHEVFPELSIKENLAKTVTAAFAERQRREHPAISLNLAQNQYKGPVETVNTTLDISKLSSQKRLECNE